MKIFSSTRRPAILYGIVMWAISFVIAGFLIQLGGSIIADVPLSSAPVERSDFIDQAASAEVEAQIAANERDQSDLIRSLTELNAEHAAAVQKYASARTGFDNWIRARSATESDAQNPEVIARTESLDVLNAAQEATREAVNVA